MEVIVKSAWNTKVWTTSARSVRVSRKFSGKWCTLSVKKRAKIPVRSSTAIATKMEMLSDSHSATQWVGAAGDEETFALQMNLKNIVRAQYFTSNFLSILVCIFKKHSPKVNLYSWLGFWLTPPILISKVSKLTS